MISICNQRIWRCPTLMVLWHRLLSIKIYRSSFKFRLPVWNAARSKRVNLMSYNMRVYRTKTNQLRGITSLWKYQTITKKIGLCYKMSYSLSFYPHNSTNPAPCYDTEAVWNSLTWPNFQITLVDSYTLPNSFGLYQPDRKTLLQMLNISISTLVYTQLINYWLVFAWHGVTTLHCLIRFCFKQT